jgi:hypothetical protein
MRRCLWWVGAAALLCIFACVALWYTQSVMHQHIVLRLPAGFFPKVVHIDKNESLRFVNLTLRPSWPASGPHPTHTTYPAFDTTVGIPPGYSWTFTFTEEGTYAFHDHFAPEMTGIVISGEKDLSQVSDTNTCAELPDPRNQAGCMEIYFKNISNTATFQEANAIFTDIAARYPRSCHTFAHDLGKNAYFAYLDGSLPDDFGQGASSCGYGFWHGFTTAMQAHKGLSAAEEFCTSLRGGTNMQVQSNQMNCYHGIGIGFVPDPPPEHLWGVFQPLIDPGLSFCDTLDGNPYYKDRCLTGVFHAMTVYMQTHIYGFAFDENSLSLCEMQAHQFQASCFNTLVAALPEFTGFDLERTVAILKESVPEVLLNEVFAYAAIIFVDAEASVEEDGRFIKQCEAIDLDFRPLCISAVINKLYNNGIPGVEYSKAIDFCAGSWVRAEEHADCFDQAASYATRVYAPEKAVEACEAIESEHGSPVYECLVFIGEMQREQ